LTSFDGFGKLAGLAACAGTVMAQMANKRQLPTKLRMNLSKYNRNLHFARYRSF
jgi:uncharacterized OsmC-like protein